MPSFHGAHEPSVKSNQTYILNYPGLGVKLRVRFIGGVEEPGQEGKGKESSGDVPLYWLIHPYVLKSGTWPNGVGEKRRQMAPCGLEGTQGFTPSQRCKIRALNAHDSFGVVDI